jgi:hypothetical protein
MISRDELYALRYYFGFVLVLVSFYVYSGVTGWKWVGGEKTEKEKPEGGTHGGRYYRHYYHK